MEPAGTPEPYQPHVAVTDDDRDVIIRQIQQAIAADQIEFDDLDDRLERVYDATNRAELDLVTADLPVPEAPEPIPLRHPLAAQHFVLFGDIKIGGWADVEGDMTFGTVFGDIVVDLSSAHLPDSVTITTWSVFGDTTVILPDGCRCRTEAILLLGDRRIDLVPPQPEPTQVSIKIRKVLGDAKVYSLSRVPEGKLRRLWKSLRSS